MNYINTLMNSYYTVSEGSATAAAAGSALLMQLLRR